MKQISIFLIIFIFTFVQSQSNKNEIDSTKLPNYTGKKITSHNGYLEVRKAPEMGRLYYWFFPAEKTPENKPLVLWLTGGPGCSSMIGIFGEHGPFRVISSTQLEYNQNTWIKKANIIYLDQPLGVGFSFSKNTSQVTNSKIAAIDINTALIEFFKLFPSFKKNDFYLAGETYAGKYLSYFWDYYTNSQKELNLNLKGILLGNAMMSPKIQYSVYSDMSYYDGIVDYRTKVEMNDLYRTCLYDLENKNWMSAQQESCIPLFSKKMIQSSDLSPYDLRVLYKDADYAKPIRLYLDRTDVRTALNIHGSSVYHNCDNTTFYGFIPEFHQDVPDHILPQMLSKTRVLFYDGQFDLRVGVVSTSEYLRTLNWTGRAIFNNLRQNIFRIENENTPLGQFKTYAGLTQLMIYSAGHVSPRDAPVAAYEMFSRFISPTANLCPVSQPNCIEQNLNYCPQNCSSHGICLTGKNESNPQCSCYPGYFGKTCTTGYFNHEVTHSGRTFKGLINGKEMNIYQFEFIPTETLINIFVSLKLKSRTGTPYLFMSIKEKKDALSFHEARKLVDNKILDDVYGSVKDYGFMFVNNSNGPVKTISVLEAKLTRLSPNVITLVVYNSNDFICEYDLNIKSENGGGRTSLSIILTGSIFIIVFIIFIEVALLMASRQAQKPIIDPILETHMAQ
eukprot:gene11818-5149_t